MNLPPRLASPLLLLGLVLCTTRCGLLEGRKPPRLRKGLRVEVQGKNERPGVADDIEQKDPGKDVEARGSLEVAEDGQVSLLGVPLILDERTEFEDEDDEEIDRPEELDGLWVKVRGQVRDGSLRVRKAQLEEPDDDWEIEGPVTAVEGEIPGPPGTFFEVAPFRLQTRPGTDVVLVDAEKEWRRFLDEGPLAVRASKESKFLPYSVELGENSRLGGQLAFEGEREDNYDLRSARDRDKDQLQIRASVSLLHKLPEDWGFLVLQGQAVQEYEYEEGGPNDQDFSVAPTEVYAFLQDFLGMEGLHLQIGRQDLDEQREWLYDDLLDAFRVYYQRGRWELESSLSRTPTRLTPSNALPVTNFYAAANYRADEDWLLTAYVLDRRSRDLNEASPFHYGLRSYVKPDPGFHHWFEYSRVDGLFDGRRLDGQAFDLGVGYVLDHALEPSITLSYAHADGGPIDDRHDRNFRQTGLQDNNGKWNGITSFRYYGELFEPELSNLQILTAGVGIRPDRRSSIDLVFHDYRQDFRREGPLSSELRAPTNGLSRDLGREVDLIFGMRRPRWTLELIGGVFTPGPAFDRDDTALFASAQLRLKF